ncbi:ATP-grasp fold amidoligase family protein [Robertmurraya sp.]|uniref:ATP-grasp fold amidoligase family protein n=1 Tax=Robertmurraya sp. TaxID=2837525 RepID=UPI003704A828
MKNDPSYFKDYLKLRFKRYYGYELDLDHPKTFAEKIQWIKLYGELERFSKYVDKYKVRRFIKKRIGEEYLIPLVGFYKNADDIDLDVLPNSFAMKATHGSRWNILVKDKSQIDWKAAKQKMAKWIKSSYYTRNGERQYKPIKGHIVIEKLLQDSWGGLKNYRVFCFHGKPKYIMVDLIDDKYTDLYDLYWNRIRLNPFVNKSFPKTVKKPKRFDELISIAGQLSRDFAFVRVDMYYANDRILFGELSFTPDNGFNRSYPIELDIKLGNLLDLTRYV